MSPGHTPRPASGAAKEARDTCRCSKSYLCTIVDITTMPFYSSCHAFDRGFEAQYSAPQSTQNIYAARETQRKRNEKLLHTSSRGYCVSSYAIYFILYTFPLFYFDILYTSYFFYFLFVPCTLLPLENPKNMEIKYERKLCMRMGKMAIRTTDTEDNFLPMSGRTLIASPASPFATRIDWANIRGVSVGKGARVMGKIYSNSRVPNKIFLSMGFSSQHI